MKPILVTGATGFLGTHVVEQLRARGEGPLRLLCRGASRWDGVPGLEIVQGDIAVEADVARAVAGTRAVCHLAGVVSRDEKDAPLLHRVHVEGTRWVCRAALRHSVEKVVVASSSGTIAVSHDPIIHDENSGYKEREIRDWSYYRTKMEAEKESLAFHREHGLPVVVVNPALLLGPGDERGSSTGDVAAFLEGQIISLPRGGMSFVDARDCAAGVIGAMDRGRAGERYLLGGVNWTFRHVMETVGKIAGVAAPKMRVPLWMSLAAAPLLRRAMPLIGRKFELDDVTIRMSDMFWYFTSAKAERELGFQARPPEETLAVTVEEIRRARRL